MKPQEMWAVVNDGGFIWGIGEQKGLAKNRALSYGRESWKEAKRLYGWRLQRVIVTPVEREQRFAVKLPEDDK